MLERKWQVEDAKTGLRKKQTGLNGCRYKRPNTSRSGQGHDIQIDLELPVSLLIA